MDWKKTKTIFILTFLILNIFLGYQLSQKMDKSNLKYLSEQPLEKRLADNNIDYKDSLPQSYKDHQTLISGQRAPFSANEIKSKTSKLDSSSTDTTLIFNLKKPLELDKNDLVKDVSQFLKDDVYRGDEYRFYKKDTKNHKIWFTQIYQGQPLFFDTNDDTNRPSGMVMFEWNEKGYLTRYTQTFISVYRQGTPQEIISPMKALGSLFNTQHLSSGDKINKIVLGYYSLANVEDVQVYAPTWSIETEDAHFLVNATDSSIQEIDREQ
ncbi:two-component system regulatory protein YycI [Fictibacillus sp. WQ 8-8]|uniref:two-component system regulatory protein YycI n=1 Tax=unclassified Fictibacillus TaxID=2644029 RepID=UPI0006A77353|nr:MULTISPECIES: two-component system regulatory protein YycI [unclassified Fictibacillus]MCQ6265041.1 two-component system regulatory protein YycI [Fictibacillus sp. WQ 8-8]MED2972323.1 two-component system regulatory protein YycI [Fictibacillus sp. B-59209]UZJ79026.1 two-component system regulatory protein YycI [Fictibacillus sp. KU28468]SFE97173.1 Two-component signal transduction system YycFG, regulatory protein YycI [Bacillus sp. OV194]